VDRVLDITELIGYFLARSTSGAYGGLSSFGAHRTASEEGRLLLGEWTWALNGFGRSPKHEQRIPKRTSCTVEASTGRHEKCQTGEGRLSSTRLGTKPFQGLKSCSVGSISSLGDPGGASMICSRTAYPGRRLGVAAHVADKISITREALFRGRGRHQPHEFLAERRAVWTYGEPRYRDVKT